MSMKCDLQLPVAPASVPALQGVALEVVLAFHLGLLQIKDQAVAQFFQFGLLVCAPLFEPYLYSVP
jgi:hypothetical protein